MAAGRLGEAGHGALAEGTTCVTGDMPQSIEEPEGGQRGQSGGSSGPHSTEAFRTWGHSGV